MVHNLNLYFKLVNPKNSQPSDLNQQFRLPTTWLHECTWSKLICFWGLASYLYFIFFTKEPDSLNTRHQLLFLCLLFHRTELPAGTNNLIPHWLFVSLSNTKKHSLNQNTPLFPLFHFQHFTGEIKDTTQQSHIGAAHSLVVLLLYIVISITDQSGGREWSTYSRSNSVKKLDNGQASKREAWRQWVLKHQQATTH